MNEKMMDTAMNKIDKFSSTGRFLLNFTSKGHGAVEMMLRIRPIIWHKLAAFLKYLFMLIYFFVQQATAVNFRPVIARFSFSTFLYFLLRVQFLLLRFRCCSYLISSKRLDLVEFDKIFNKFIKYVILYLMQVKFHPFVFIK